MPKETDVVKRAAEFCSSAKFERVFDVFVRENADAFMDAVEAKDGDAEHKHELLIEHDAHLLLGAANVWNRYKELHDRYLQLFEEKLSEFIESEGATIDEFFRECRGVVDGHFTALFEDHEHAWFVDHLLASMDYEHFYTLMVNEARRLHRK